MDLTKSELGMVILAVLQYGETSKPKNDREQWELEKLESAADKLEACYHKMEDE